MNFLTTPGCSYTIIHGVHSGAFYILFYIFLYYLNLTAFGRAPFGGPGLM